MSKFDRTDRKGNPITIETDSHGIVRKTFKKLSELGYIENYQETFKKKSLLLLPKLAFANGNIGDKTDIFNMQFQKSEKVLDFEDENLRRMFPMVFSKRGILETAGYTLESQENGEVSINYNKEKRKANKKMAKEVARTNEVETQEGEKQGIKERYKSDLSLEEQKARTEQILRDQVSEKDTGEKGKGEIRE